MPEVYVNSPILAAGSENLENFSNRHELQTINDSGAYSPYTGSQGVPSAASPMSAILSFHGNDVVCNDDFLGGITYELPCLTILDQPCEKFRFRYKSEMVGTHGSLLGAKGNRNSAPMVKLNNYSEKAIIRCTLVTSDEGQRIPHVHKLVRRVGGVDYDDPHNIEISSECGHVATFNGMAIIHTAKKNVKDELAKKLQWRVLDERRKQNPNATLHFRDEAEIRTKVESYHKYVNLNSVALCFEAFIPGENGIMSRIAEPVYSHAINNLKSALTGELKICRMDKSTGSVEGREEIFIFVEKVSKKNIRIKFYEMDENNEIWSAYGSFSELDVHHQYAIAFKTPAYRDLNITSPKQVSIQLERPSDGDVSEPMTFTYKPSDRIMGRKRPRISNSGSSDLSHILPSVNISKESIMESINSGELKKLLSEGINPSINKDLLTDLDVEEYFKYMCDADGGPLTADSSANSQHQDDIMFARDILIDIVRYMKQDSNGDEHIQKLLKVRTTYGDTPLHAALRYGQNDIVKYLLLLICYKDCKSILNLQNTSGKTPLHYAILQNQPEVTKALLMLGADPNQPDEGGFSPLHLAVKIPDAGACVDALLSSESTDIRACNDVGWSALHLAAEAGSYNAVRSLVRAGADVNSIDKSCGRTALHIAVEGGHKAIVEFLLKKTDISVNMRNFSGNTALHTAVVHPGIRAKELCELLIQHGADPRIQNHDRESNDEDKKKDPIVNVKVEVDSEDENMEAGGQSSFDLAMNKPDILQLFDGQSDETTKQICVVTTKLELKDENLEINWLNSEHKEKLAVILDKSTGWKKLAEHLNIDYLFNTFQPTFSSPSSLILNYIDVQGTLSISETETVLREIGEEEAANYVRSISFMYS